jgi:hypothetical protein
MTTRWLDLRYPLAGAIALLLIYASWPERLTLIAVLILLLLLFLIGAIRFVADAGVRVTNGGGFPSQMDRERESDHDFDILMLEQDILTRLNQTRQARKVAPVALHCDLLFLARRHSLRMIKVPFFGTWDVEEGDICDRVLSERDAFLVGAKALRFSDDKPQAAEYCLRVWMRRKKTRRILLHSGFQLAAVGVVRNARNGSLYVTCLLETPSQPTIS